MQLNQQAMEKQDHSSDGSLEVFKIFPTIQGEGPFTGRRSIFVRLAGCNLQCPLCDTDYTSNRVRFQPAALVIAITHHSVKGERPVGGGKDLVVITGGEPFRQNLKPFVELLLATGYDVQIETNGTLYQELPFDKITVVCSPKTGAIHRKLAQHIAALKYVASAGDIAQDDGLPNHALEHTASPRLARPPEGFKGRIYLQPIDSTDSAENEKHYAATIDSVMKHGHTLCIQTHKLVGME